MSLSVVNQFAQKLRKSLTLVVGPDHPLLLNGPDILIASEGILTAVFIPHAHELKKPDYLLVRLGLSRLAYPPHMRCVLVVDKIREEHLELNRLSRNFHESLRTSEWKNLNKFVEDPNAGRNQVGIIPTDIRQKMFSRYVYALEETEKYLSTQSRKRNATRKLSRDKILMEGNRLAVRMWTSQEDSLLPNNVRVIENYLVSVCSFKRGAVTSKLRPSINAAMQHSFGIDNGVPYARQNVLSMNVMVVDEAPHNKIDSLKPIRATSFAGWVLTRPEHNEDVSEIGSLINLPFERATNGDISNEYNEQEDTDD